MSTDNSPVVRVFVPTFRRGALLRRALESLIAQTFERWICEVHNDDPTDDTPGMLLSLLNDPRITLVQHQRNLGAADSFNLFYQSGAEPFSSILEDDNWWEPNFLAEMYRQMQDHPDVVLAWCNQIIWEEQADGSWLDTGRLVNPVIFEGSILIHFGHARQTTGALHSHGAMLLRSRASVQYITPPGWPLGAIENLRERMVSYPMLYVSKPLAVFAKTLDSARKESRAEWTIAQTFLAATFIKHLRISGTISIREMVDEAQAREPPSTTPLIFSSIVAPSCWRVLLHLKPRHWGIFIRGIIRRPKMLIQVVISRRTHRPWWDLLDRSTRQRFVEAHTQVSEHNFAKIPDSSGKLPIDVV